VNAKTVRTKIRTPLMPPPTKETNSFHLENDINGFDHISGYYGVRIPQSI
jgi:hypothetical protein